MKKLYFLSILAGAIVSCDKYLDIEPKGSVIPRTVEEYDLLLNGIHSTSNEDVLALTADDFNLYTFNSSQAIDVKSPDNQDFQLYSWGDFRFYNITYPVLAWNTSYSNIYINNKIINEVIQSDPSLSFKEEDKFKIQAEAYYNRALDYFFLANIFAKAYSSSADRDFSVPIVTKADVTQYNLQRATVKEVYDFIINDLEKSLEYLPAKSKAHIRPNIGSGYALLSRVYLYKGDYQNSLEYANKAIGISNVTLQDYVNFDETKMEEAYSFEQYSIRYFGATAGYGGSLSNNLKTVLSTTDDARYYKFYEVDPNYGEGRISYQVTPNAAPSVGEMYITRAECYARLGKKDLAIADLNTLREKRLKNYTPLQSADFSSDKDLIKFCLEERRRETFQSHLRLFDVKRMNLEPDFATTLVKEFQGETYKAEPNSGKLVLPIPAQVMKFNPSWKNN
ncbi:RagB/SusD family nutrient uptake outer membrane protein [Capnocytophaga canimorsus]|uniref:RagB/SusD family nutrient uptake outer membrane protein n=1 Tax=Capnocytophaga canimorsus TaxID=28188 RepID=UPI0037D143E8